MPTASRAGIHLPQFHSRSHGVYDTATDTLTAVPKGSVRIDDLNSDLWISRDSVQHFEYPVDAYIPRWGRLHNVTIRVIQPRPFNLLNGEEWYNISEMRRTIVDGFWVRFPV